MRRHVQSARSSLFVDLEHVRPDEAAADAVFAHAIDILVDLTSLTYKGRIGISRLKPAPVVISYLGYPGTTGCRLVDFAMADSVAAPPEIVNSFTEKVIFFPFTYQANSMPLDIAPCAIDSNGHGDSDSVAGHDEVTTNCHHRMAKYNITTHPHTPSSSRQRQRQRQRRQVYLCSFNANKKLESISFRSTIYYIIHSSLKDYYFHICSLCCLIAV